MVTLSGRPPSAGPGRRATRATAAALALCVAAPAPAIAGSAYGIRTQSTSVLGSAQAGMSAGPYDLSRIALNPAALGLGSGMEVTNSIAGVFVRQTASSVVGTTAFGTPTGGGNGGTSGTSAPVPNFYSAVSLDERVRVALGTTTYYGLGSKWDNGWIGRYYAGSASILAADIMPVVSFRPIPSLVLAGGPVIEYVRVKTNTALDLGSVDVLLTGGAFGGVPGGSDGNLSTRSESWSAGVILGATYEPWQGGRIGLSWRSQIRHKLTGDATFSAGGPAGQALAAATGGFVNTGVRSSLNHPSVLIFGISQDVTPALTLFADAQRLGWQSLQDATLVFKNPAQPPARTTFNLRDNWYVAVGGRYQVDEMFAVRAGLGFDQPTTRNDTRTVLLADQFALWTTIGLEVRVSDRIRIDLAYGHLFSRGAQVNQTTAIPGNELRGNLSANIRTVSDFFAVQMAWKF